MSSGKQVPIGRALVSVSDKTGLVDFVSQLATTNIDIISTGGTAQHLRDAGLTVTSVSQVTDFPEIMDGRVKTLHPRIHGGLLADRDKDSHMQALLEHGINPIDMVVVNLYPFAKTVAQQGVTLDDAIEQIDIGGPAMIRAGAKNFRGVAVVTDPADYAAVSEELQESGGRLFQETMARLAQKAFAHTSQYDGMISEYLGGTREELPADIHLTFHKSQDLRYGENPHQKAAFYTDPAAPSGVLADMRQLHGKELSYNNIIDLESAWKLACEFDSPACAIIKHNNPCGAALGSTAAEAYRKAFESDTVSAFGSVIGFSVPVDLEAAEAMKDLFVEAVIAPGYAPDALERLREKKNLRLMQLSERAAPQMSVRLIEGGALLQSPDIVVTDPETMDVVTDRQPTGQEWSDLLFAWTVAAHVKSNAIVLVKDGATVGVGAGQMSRLDSSYIALRKAGDRAKGAVVASDAFFPFPDALEVVVDGGATACIHPGGSIRDDQVTDYARGAGIAMVLTGRRHFRH